MSQTRSDHDDRRRSDGGRTETDRDVDATGDPVPKAEREADAEPEPTGPTEGPGGREIVVPLRLYKTVTVFSTLIAIIAFVGGFILIDAATLQVSLLRTVIGGALASVGLTPSADVLTAALAAAGLVSIVFGSAVYVFGTRFRARGMGKSQEDSGEE
ncbi:DUF7315 family membrane protein [Halopenitus persicus]|uniref:DUF7315 domain-containing protein n=1 Tax=Halopenitus persicus TaxID=1048396 RepID=A0A1H3IQC9_9EURY|nr:hypothetical protein [Halopenitus persicus]SDY30023.1 hypothetical protein SAMN05216564_104224 [Halopenitus persicus]